MENIYVKLLKIQKEIKGLSKDKNSHNYDYVTGNKLLSFIKPLMDKYGLILKQEIISIDNVRQDYKVWDKWFKNSDGTQGQWKPKAEILSKVMMKFTWIDCESGEKDENFFGANGQNDWEKGLGSALTYAERYFLLKYFHIPTDKDDIDSPDRKPNEEQKLIDPVQKQVAKPKLTEDKYKSVLALTEIARVEKALDYYELTKEQKAQLDLKIVQLKKTA